MIHEFNTLEPIAYLSTYNMRWNRFKLNSNTIQGYFSIMKLDYMYGKTNIQWAMMGYFDPSFMHAYAHSRKNVGSRYTTVVTIMRTMDAYGLPPFWLFFNPRSRSGLAFDETRHPRPTCT